MAIGWRKLFGLRETDGMRLDVGPHVPEVKPRNFVVGDSIAGEFRVLDKFAGGMGFVYLVKHHSEEAPFVLKTLQRPEHTIPGRFIGATEFSRRPARPTHSRRSSPTGSRKGTFT